MQAFKSIPEVVSATPVLKDLQSNLETSVVDGGGGSSNGDVKGIQQREISTRLLSNTENLSVNQSL